MKLTIEYVADEVPQIPHRFILDGRDITKHVSGIRVNPSGYATVELELKDIEIETKDIPAKKEAHAK